MLWNYGLKHFKLIIKCFYAWPPPPPHPPPPQVPILFYSSTNIKNFYVLYTYVLKFTWTWKNKYLWYSSKYLSYSFLIFSSHIFLNQFSLKKYLKKNISKLFSTWCRRSLHYRTVFKNLKNQSQCYMTIFRKSKNQSGFYNHHASRISIK